MNMHLPLAALTALLLSHSAYAGTFAGFVTHVSDGDTVTLDANGKTMKIRLADIDAPEVAHGLGERDQPFGQSSKHSLAQLVNGKEVVASCKGRSYEREICRVRIGSTDVSEEQVRRGLAWVYKKYNRDSHLTQLEQLARQQRAGLWQDANPIYPSEWRHNDMATR